MRESANGHIIIEPKDCKCLKDDAIFACPICDQGLAICAVCNAAEIELEENCLVRVARMSPKVLRLIQAIKDVIGPKTDTTNFPCHLGITTAAKCGRCSREAEIFQAIEDLELNNKEKP